MPSPRSMPSSCGSCPASARTSPPRSGSSWTPATVRYHRELLQQFPPTILDAPAPSGRWSQDGGAALRHARHRSVEDAGRRRARRTPPQHQGHGRRRRKRSSSRRSRNVSAMPDGPAAARVRRRRRHCPLPARARPDMSEFVPVGSLRRGCETCGDIDILAVGGEPGLMDIFVAVSLASSGCSPAARRKAASGWPAASRPTCDWCRRRAAARPCSTSPARRRTTSRCAISPSSAV